jgi:hypothetical protein
LLWSNFEQTKDPYIVICKASPSCNAKIRRPDGSTFVMLAHFEARHPCPVNGIYCKIQNTMEEKVSNLWLCAAFVIILPELMVFWSFSIVMQNNFESNQSWLPKVQFYWGINYNLYLCN